MTYNGLDYGQNMSWEDIYSNNVYSEIAILQLMVTDKYELHRKVVFV